MSKPGYGKYAAFRGPHPGNRAEYLTFWQADAARNDRFLQEATEAGDARLIKLAKRQRREIEEALAVAAQ